MHTIVYTPVDNTIIVYFILWMFSLIPVILALDCVCTKKPGRVRPFLAIYFFMGVISLLGYGWKFVPDQLEMPNTVPPGLSYYLQVTQGQ